MNAIFCILQKTTPEVKILQNPKCISYRAAVREPNTYFTIQSQRYNTPSKILTIGLFKPFTEFK
jgi:hypothetical protein